MTIMNSGHIMEYKGKTMMKWALSIALLLTMGGRTGMAGTVNVDFSALGTTVCEIGATASAGNGCTLGNVEFFYDDFGSAALNGTANISNSGISGFAGTAGLGGALEFIFNPTATPAIPIVGGLFFHFTVGTATGPLANDPNGAFVMLSNGDANTFATDSTGAGMAFFDVPASPYTQVTTFFSSAQTASNFHVSDLMFDTTPEPASFILIGTALLGLGCARKLSRRRS